jgi:hypothetical protein
LENRKKALYLYWTIRDGNTKESRRNLMVDYWERIKRLVRNIDAAIWMIKHYKGD